MSRLPGVRLRLTLAFLVVVAIALGVVSLVVMPSLQTALVQSKLRELERAMPTVSRQAPADPLALADFLETASASANARIVIYRVLVRQPLALTVTADSHQTSSTDVGNDATALLATSSGKRRAGTVERGGSTYAEVAEPVGEYTFLLSSPLTDVLRNLDLVERRLAYAGALALVVAAVIGYLAAWVAALRLQRLERSADRIAGGHFDEPVGDRGADEIGQLAAAFDRMRLRLAQLENARREFIANASHELRTPLFALGGSLELLSDEELDDETRRDFLETMREQVQRLTKLATELLDLSRLDAGRIEPARESVDLGQVADDLAAEFLAVAASTGHRLTVEAASVLALADADRVFQIGRALVENAIRHTPAGSSVRVVTGQEGARAVLAVEDDGPGILPEHAEHVFERFYRAEGGRASGSGLGLAIARELAKLMDGVVELESQPGRTVFTLALPAAADPGASAAA